MSSSDSHSTDRQDRWLLLVGVAALWVPAMVAASYEWGNGTYYSYGWFVPVAALWLMVKRVQDFQGTIALPSRKQVLPVVFLLLPWLTALRILGQADPSWRLPMGLLGMTAVVTSHALIWKMMGARASAGFAWITLLLISALPWPTVVEAEIVRSLTRGVVVFVTEVFHFLGKPVEIMGDRLQLHDLNVEVTDGCSGVRSFQSFVMATWFFAELQRLRLGRALLLLAGACVVAFLVNSLRTFALAEIRFTEGEAAFKKAHDLLGLAAFAISAVVFFVMSGTLSEIPRRTLVKTRQVL